VLAVRTLRYLVLGQALLFCAFAGAFSFATKFFADEFHLASTTKKEEAVGAAIAGSLGLLGIIIGGLFASRIGDRYHEIRPAWRITVGGWCLALSFGCIAVFVLVPLLPAAMLALLIVNICNIIALANLGAVTADVIPARMRGTGFAVAQFLVTIGSATGALIVGGASTLAGENLRVGIGALLIPRGLGAVVILAFARRTYEDDRARVIAEASG
jgi:MFS family permease